MTESSGSVIKPPTTLEHVWREGRLTRRQWSATDKYGGQLLCLYTALVGDADARPETCPASVCPSWLAYLLPWIDDAGTDGRWPAVVERVTRLAPGFKALRPEVEWRVRALCVREAMRHTDVDAVLAVCERVAVLCERRGRSETVSDTDFEAAREEASEAAAAEAAASKSWAAAETAAEAACAAAAEATSEAAASEAAAEAAYAAAEATSEVEAAAEAEAAADRLIDAILDAIEGALEAV